MLRPSSFTTKSSKKLPGPAHSSTEFSSGVRLCFDFCVLPPEAELVLCDLAASEFITENPDTPKGKGTQHIIRAWECVCVCERGAEEKKKQLL